MLLLKESEGIEFSFLRLVIQYIYVIYICKLQTLKTWETKILIFLKMGIFSDKNSKKSLLRGV